VHHVQVEFENCAEGIRIECEATRAGAPESTHQQKGEKSLPDGNAGLSVAEGNCVVERRGGEQPEAKDQSINKTMLNSIRPRCIGEPAYPVAKPRMETVP
jgi:hypothetical protein